MLLEAQDEFKAVSPDDFKLTEKQDEALDIISSHPLFILLYGGSRSAKTFLNVWLIVWRALAVAKSRHAILRFRFNHVKSSIIYDTFPKVMSIAFPDCSYKLDKQDWYATFPNGSEIWFGGLDDKERTEKILGNEYATIFLNECSQISYASFLMLKTRLAQLSVLFTPKELHVLSREMRAFLNRLQLPFLVEYEKIRMDDDLKAQLKLIRSAYKKVIEAGKNKELANFN